MCSCYIRAPHIRRAGVPQVVSYEYQNLFRGLARSAIHRPTFHPVAIWPCLGFVCMFDEPGIGSNDGIVTTIKPDLTALSALQYSGRQFHRWRNELINVADRVIRNERPISEEFEMGVFGDHASNWIPVIDDGLPCRPGHE